jgi:hypothetical protein
MPCKFHLARTILVRRTLDESRFWAIVHQLKSYPAMSGFFEELKRRKVYRVAAAYIIAAGFIIQVAPSKFAA